MSEETRMSEAIFNEYKNINSRIAITNWLKSLLEIRISKIDSYWATEVSLDYGTKDVRRIDYLQFEPASTIGVSGIEKGIFTCYEIKSCKEDFNSGFGRNFIGEKNYFVMTMPTYKEVVQEIPMNVGVLVAIPDDITDYEEFENPHEPMDSNYNWKLKVILPSKQQLRKRSMTELLFCMLRSGK